MDRRSFLAKAAGLPAVALAIPLIDDAPPRYNGIELQYISELDKPTVYPNEHQGTAIEHFQDFMMDPGPNFLRTDREVLDEMMRDFYD
jgi:hypothetical protein